tara:strand:+ start:436 stop:612 length:177 start_codon:yes stop_codon:yes gene_type:complete
MHIDRKVLSTAIAMLKKFAADQVALEPKLRREYSYKQCVKVIEALEDAQVSTGRLYRN